MSELCDRCNSVGSDRRTLWMACLYAMNELSVPFTELRIRGTVQKRIGEQEYIAAHAGIPALKGPLFEDPRDGDEPRNFPMFTLRVCKRCRAEWMRAIERWYHEPPDGEDNDADAPVPESERCTYCQTEELEGIYVRRDGDTVPICRRCWDREYAASPK